MNKAKLGFLVMLVVTLLALLLPASDVLAVKVWVASWLPGARWMDQADLTNHGDKWTHALLFLSLGWLGMRAWHARQQRQGLALAILLLGIATEILQNWIPGRGPSVADFVADALGLAVGAMLGWRGAGGRC